MPLEYLPIAFRGGLDRITPSIEANPGSCHYLNNYECDTRGRYRRIRGYERYDGQPKPSDYIPVGDSYEDEIVDARTQREARRSVITAVPGTGAVRGVFVYQDDVYALRDYDDGENPVECRLYKSSASGWGLVTTPTLLPGGSYRFVTGNFAGGADGIRIYGCDGVNPAFEFDGTTFTQITNPGMTGSDTPQHIAVHDGRYLLLGYAGGSLQYSALGDPHDFAVANGAGEIAVGAEINGLVNIPGDAIIITSRQKIYALYGKTSADWRLEIFSENNGARDHTQQWIGDLIFLDETGLTRLQRTQTYGNLAIAELAPQIKPLIPPALSQVVCTFTAHERNQYRVVLYDGSGFIFTFQGEDEVHCSQFTYPINPTCVWSTTIDAVEAIFAGAEDGFVYQLERGTSFDGDPYNSVAQTKFSAFETTEHNKAYKKLQLQLSCPGRCTIKLTPDFDYAISGTREHSAYETEVLGDGGIWNESEWDEGRWNAAALTQAETLIRGRGRSIAVQIFSESDIEPPHALQSMTIHFDTQARRR